MNDLSRRPAWVDLITPKGDLDITGELDRKFRIGDLAEEFNVTLRTLRFYEDRGLIAPERIGARRLYSHADRARLRVILLAKKVGFSLVDIEAIMSMYDSEKGTGQTVGNLLAMFKQQRSVLDEQRAALEEAQRTLDETIKALEKSA